MEDLRVFTYGTLKPGNVYFQQYCVGRVAEIAPAIALGNLFSLPLGYPAMTEGKSYVHGFVLSFSDTAILQELDELEGYQVGRSPELNEYDRQLIEVFSPNLTSIGYVWTYVMTSERAKSLGGVFLPEGIWH